MNAHWTYRRAHAVLAMTVAVGLGAIFVPFTARAQSPSASAPSELDLVILVDQSGSMWGHPRYHPQPNDRYGHRVGAAKAILERLAADVKGTPRIHRFSVVDFGDAVEVAWSNQVLRHDPLHPDALSRRLELELPRRVVAREWVGTNTPEALAVAAAELRRMDAAMRLPNRRRIVLLITDGRPQLPPASLGLMKQRSRLRATELLGARAELWVVALNDASNYWLDGDGAFWEQLVGAARTYLAERPVPDLPRGVDRMVDDWLATSSQHDPHLRRYPAPPYLGRLAFRVSFEKPLDPSAVRVLGPDGRPLPRVSATAGSPATYARFAVDDPAAGLYTLDGGTAAVYWVPEPQPPSIRRLAPAQETDLATEVRVAHSVALGSGKALVPLAKWPLVTLVEVVAPNGSRVELPATYAKDGKLISRWRPRSAGVHRLRLHARTQVDGRTVDVLQGARGAESTVDVSTRRPVWLRLERPAPDRGVPTTPWAKTATVRLVLVDGDGKELDAAGLVKGAADWLRVQRLDASGVSLGAPLPLTLERKGFAATIPIAPAWRGSNGLFGLGELYLRVSAAPGRLPADRVLRGIALPESLELRRVGSDPMSVGPIEISLARWLALLAVAVTALIVLAVVGLAGSQLVPAMRIRHLDRLRGRGVELRVYDVVGDPSGAAAQKFAVSGETSFTFDGKVQLTVGGETKIAERFRVTRLDMPGRARARLVYRWAGEQKNQETQLTAGGGPKTLRVEAAIAGRPVAELAEV